MRLSALSLRLSPALTALALLAAGVFAMMIAPTASALTISPVRLELTIDPGRAYTGEMILKNDQSVPKTYYASFENFEARGESGMPYFIPGREGLAGWLDGSSEVTLAAGERRTIPFTITVPSDAKPGGYFAAILWNDTPPAPLEGGQVAIGAKVGSLVLLRVAGDVPENGGVTAFASEDGKTMFNALPVKLVWRFQNSGGDRVKPEGNVRITNTLGMLSAELPANPTKGNILPGSARKFDVTWAEETTGSGSTIGMDFLSAAREQSRHWRMGRYVASLALSYGQSGNTGGSDFVFYVFPWQLLTLLLGALVIVFVLGRFILSGYKRRIIAAAQSAAAGSQAAPRATKPSTKPVSRKKKDS